MEWLRRLDPRLRLDRPDDNSSRVQQTRLKNKRIFTVQENFLTSGFQGIVGHRLIDDDRHEHLLQA